MPPRSIAAELDAFRSLYAARAAKAQIAILTGSLPAGAAHGFFRELLADTACPAIVDVRGPELFVALERGIFLVKPNREELARTVGREITGDAELHAAMLELNDARRRVGRHQRRSETGLGQLARADISAVSTAGRGGQSDWIGRLPGCRHRLGVGRGLRHAGGNSPRNGRGGL